MSGIEIAFVGYICRGCGEPTEVGVCPRMIEGERYLCPINHRLYHGTCDECGTERVHVLDAPGADDAYDGRPIDYLAHPEAMT